MRFLPPPDEADDTPHVGEVTEERGDLAEVISLRSRLITRDGDTTRATGEGSVAEPEPDDAPKQSAYEDGLRTLGRRARTRGELQEDLLNKSHDPAEIEAVLDEFERSYYLDDIGLARVMTEKLRGSKRASRAQIRRKLRERRLPDDVIETVVGELDEEEEQALLLQTAQDRARRLTGLDRATAERRLLGFLARRGWGGEPALRATRAALDGSGGEPTGGVRFRP